MATGQFHYRAKDGAGKLLAGVVDAASSAEARQKLRKQNLFVLEISDAASPAARPVRGISIGGSRVRKTDLLALMSQLTIMNQSGVDLAESLRNAALQSPNPQLRLVLDAVYADVSSGVTFSAALAGHPAVFDETFTAGIAAAEKSGTIAAVFERLTYLLRSEIRLRSTIWSMLMYPMVLGFVTFGVLVAMFFFVLPQFATVFSDLGTTPPPLTAALLAVGAFARENLIAELIAVGVLVGGFVLLRRHEQFQRCRDWVILNFLLVRDAARNLITGRSFRMLGTILQTGVPLLDGIRLSRDAVRNRFYRAMFAEVETDVLQGRGLAPALARAAFLPVGAAHMVATAERSGRLGEVLQSVGEYYEDEGERKLRDIIKILEPVIILGLGAVVACVVLSIVLPLLDVTSVSGK